MAKCHNPLLLSSGLSVMGLRCFYTLGKLNESTSVKASETTGAIQCVLGFIALAGAQKIQLPTRSLSDVNYPSTAVFTWTDTHAQKRSERWMDGYGEGGRKRDKERNRSREVGGGSIQSQSGSFACAK